MEYSVIWAVLFHMDGVVADTQEAVTVFWQNVPAAHSAVCRAAVIGLTGAGFRQRPC